LSLSLGGDHGDDLLLLVEGAALGAESSAGELDRVLFLSLVSGFNHFHHLAFIGGLAADLADDGANSGDSGVELTLAVGGLVLLLISSLLELSDNETLVKTDVDTTLCQLLLLIFNWINQTLLNSGQSCQVTIVISLDQSGFYKYSSWFLCIVT